MPKEKGIGVSALVRTDDWLSVWIAFLVLSVLIAGFAVRMPDWKWMTADEFTQRIPGWRTQLASLDETLTSTGATRLKAGIQALRAALDARLREKIQDAAAKLSTLGDEEKNGDLRSRVKKLGTDIRTAAAQRFDRIFSWDNLKGGFFTLLGFWILGLLATAFLREKVARFLVSFPLLFLIAAVSFLISGNSLVSSLGIEYVFWALLVGLFISNVLGVPWWLKAAAKSELYIKTGLVLLGAEMLLGTILKAGAFGMIQAIVVIAAVWYVCYWLAGRFGLDKEFGAILATGVSVCGVSAAIAAGGALKGDPKKVSHTISLILLCAVPMLVLQPLVARLLAMPLMVAGAWIGGTIDTTGAVVAAGAITGGKALDVAVVVKFAQNALIGVVAFLLALWAALKGKQKGGERPRISQIWERFPKFVLGFIAVSLVFSLAMSETTAKNITAITSGIRGLLFSLAFLSIGLETRFMDLIAMGRGRPALTFLLAQLFNLAWTLLFAWLLFGGVLFPAPSL